MNLLVLAGAYLFPNDARPHAGLFFARLLERMGPLVGRIVVVSPTSYVPAPLLGLERFSQRRKVRPHEHWRGIEVFRPEYLSCGNPKRLWFQARSMCLSALPLCESLHARYGFDIVVGYGFTQSAHTAESVARTLGLPCATWAIGSDVNTVPNYSAENRRLFGHNVRYADLVLTESDALRGAIVGKCPGARHVHTYYKGINLAGLRDRPDRAAVRAELGLAPDRTYLFSAGGVLKGKGVYEFYEAFRRLSGRWADLTAIWAGGGPERAPLERQAERDGLGERFLLPGRVPRTDVLRTMHAADLMAFPSHAEGLPNVVMEALAAGLPTVATDVGGIREVLVDGVTGLLTPPKDPAALAERIESLLADRRWGSRMARRGRKLILDHFDVERNAPVAASILRHLASGGAPDVAFPACAGVEAGRLPAETLAEAPGDEEPGE